MGGGVKVVLSTYSSRNSNTTIYLSQFGKKNGGVSPPPFFYLGLKRSTRQEYNVICTWLTSLALPFYQK